MTGRTTDAFLNVNAVVEIDVMRDDVHALPAERLPGSPTFTHGFQHRRVRPDLRMTGHARLRRRDAGIRRFADAGVAIPAVNAESVDVMLVAERHRLVIGDSLSGDRGRILDPPRDPGPRDEQDDHGRDDRSRDAI